MSEVLPPTRTRLWEEYYRAARDGESSTFDIVHRRTDGRPVALSVTISPVTHDHGEVIGLGAVGSAAIST